jgi:hypothetical protein
VGDKEKGRQGERTFFSLSPCLSFSVSAVALWLKIDRYVSSQ